MKDMNALSRNLFHAKSTPPPTYFNRKLFSGYILFNLVPSHLDDLRPLATGQNHGNCATLFLVNVTGSPK